VAEASGSAFSADSSGSAIKEALMSRITTETPKKKLIGMLFKNNDLKDLLFILLFLPVHFAPRRLTY
jgi:hypothetical protein